MAQAHVAPAPSPSLRLINATAPAKSVRVSAFPRLQNSSGLASSFKCGAPLSLSSGKRKPACQARSFSIRCEQGTKEGGGGLDVWLGRLAMLGFATGITIEVTTGKGILENFGFSTPIPTLALAVTAVVGVLTAFFIFQSASRD